MHPVKLANVVPQIGAKAQNRNASRVQIPPGASTQDMDGPQQAEQHPDGADSPQTYETCPRGGRMRTMEAPTGPTGPERECREVRMWAARDADGRIRHIALDADEIDHFVAGRSITAPNDGLRRIPVVVVPIAHR